MDKRLSLEEAVAEIQNGDTVAIGGSSLSRKPMALVRALARSGKKDLRVVVDVGGPDVDLLIGTGSVGEVVYAFVGFEVLGLAPHFRRARQSASIQFDEWTEYTVMAGLDATIKRVPFLPTHTGLGTDVLNVNRSFKRFKDPFHGEELVAVPAINPDVALIHVNYADVLGNGVILGDGHVDSLCAKAAKKTFMSCERIISPEELQRYGRDVQVLRVHTTGVIEVPWGAHPTGCAPDYRADLRHLQDYLTYCTKEDGWQSYQEQFIYTDHQRYLSNQGGVEELVARLKV
ncbi:CoA transferase subunit A [Alicyclobacillus cycloheptanicus]|uniref:Glutaconate CoA-transferase subunit A n=1 Tax=Alicyclobacillus cycloheptanicus TaxID=1457 RepID=A0ABT9XLX2_9BACL|nr:CoA-transferase [Alicyclobacillus cycloheptanicus]MDQ0191029.1 glutaconate CoA-transferase subunit A [Alicyclobacillus cycloheptanicus]WDM00920.1 CoA transferase subunit A [Alicyclobacillus cycloheptanicus]